MPDCLACKHIAPLERLPKGSPLRIQHGQWGMLARGLAYCRIDHDGFAIHAIDRCKCKAFEQELDPAKVDARRTLTETLQEAFSQWRKSL